MAAKRRSSARLEMREGPNPWRDPSPYPAEPTRNTAHTSTRGPNEYGQQDQRGHNGSMPWPTAAGETLDTSGQANLPKGWRRGTGSGGWDA